MVQQVLDARHSENFRLMLRAMRITPASPAGLFSMFVKPVPNKPMTPDAAYDETQLFVAQAYGATLGLCYYRSLGDALRQAWDRSLDRSLEQSRASMDIDIQNAQAAWNDFRVSQGRDATAQARQDASGVSAQKKRLKVDFLVALQSKKNATFPGTSDGAVNDPNVVGQNPWCQSDSEFQQAVSQEVGATNPQTTPSFNYGMDSKTREATSREQAAKTLNTMLTAKFTGYLDAFLELGEERITGLLSHGISAVARQVLHEVPFGDMIVDWIKDKIAEKSQDRLVELYKTDRERRLRLAEWHWGTYRDPSPAALPNADDFTKQVLRR